MVDQGCVTNGCHMVSGNIFLDVDLLDSEDRSLKSEISRYLWSGSLV